MNTKEEKNRTIYLKQILELPETNYVGVLTPLLTKLYSYYQEKKINDEEVTNIFKEWIEYQTKYQAKNHYKLIYYPMKIEEIKKIILKIHWNKNEPSRFIRYDEDYTEEKHKEKIRILFKNNEEK